MTQAQSEESKQLTSPTKPPDTTATLARTPSELRMLKFAQKQHSQSFKSNQSSS